MNTGFPAPDRLLICQIHSHIISYALGYAGLGLRLGFEIQTYPELERGSTSGQLNRRLQKASGGRGGGSGWCSGEFRCLKDPVRGGARHSSALDWRRDWGVPPPEAEVEGLPGPPEPPGIFGYPVAEKEGVKA